MANKSNDFGTHPSRLSFSYEAPSLNQYTNQKAHLFSDGFGKILTRLCFSSAGWSFWGTTKAQLNGTHQSSMSMELKKTIKKTESLMQAKQQSTWSLKVYPF